MGKGQNAAASDGELPAGVKKSTTSAIAHLFRGGNSKPDVRADKKEEKKSDGKKEDDEIITARSDSIKDGFFSKV